MILAGGLTSENVAGAIELVKPYAVDVVTGVEAEPVGSRQGGEAPGDSQFQVAKLWPPTGPPGSEAEEVAG